MAVIEGKEIPGSLVRSIISSSLIRVGMYHGPSHKFLPPKFRPDYESLAKEASEFGYSRKESDRIILEVLSSVGLDAGSQSVTMLDLVGEGELPLFAHVRFCEENNSATEMIYLGRQRFYILTTSRSTLMPGNIVKAREYPLNLNAVWNFDLYDGFDSNKPSVPEGYKKYQAWFQTTPVTTITVCTSPELLGIIDENESFGGVLEKNPADAGIAFASMLNSVSDVVKDLPENLPYNEQFPQYMELLGEAKSLGISTYVLDVIIENVERRLKKDYATTEKDWHVYMTKEQIEAEKREQKKRDKKRYEELVKDLEGELKNIRMRRVFLFFYASGSITDEARAHLDSICPELDQLAEKGYGTKGAAKARIAEALENTKPPKGRNAVTASIMVAVLLAASFVAYSWVTANQSIQQFNRALDAVSQMMEEGKFNDAKDFVHNSYDEFSPGYLRFLVKRKVRFAEGEIEAKIDLFINERIEQIQVMIRANRNRIDDYTWGLIVEAMAYRPEDPRLLELRQKYVAQ